jgi:hypothetical protein
MGIDVILRFSGDDEDSDPEFCPHTICRGSGNSNEYIREIFSGTVAEAKQSFLDFMARFADPTLSPTGSDPIEWEEAAVVMRTMAWVVLESVSDEDKVKAC